MRQVDSPTKRSELLPLVENAATALLNKDVDGDMVLEQGPNEDWMDTAYRYGKVLYSNVCWLSALRSLAEVDGKREEWYDVYRETRKAVVKTFKLDSSEPVGVVGLRAYKKHVWQDTVLAAEHVESEDIVKQLSKKLDDKIGPRVVHPQLPISSWRSRKWGTYHNGAFWPWFSSMHALVLNRLGFIEESWRIMRSVVKYCLYEWVNPDNESGRGPKPFRTGCATALAVLAELHDGVE
ncbi:MAG: hypothetical protein NXY59_03385 [Aigarchaeota archaeon]|nr:hypothetical protein [Candidatus Pelearchaeum maunauluense]